MYRPFLHVPFMLMCVFFILYGGVWTDILNPICITRQRTFVYFFLNAYPHLFRKKSTEFQAFPAYIPRTSFDV